VADAASAIRKLGSTDVDDAAAVLARAFFADPIASWIEPEAPPFWTMRREPKSP